MRRLGEHFGFDLGNGGREGGLDRGGALGALDCEEDVDFGAEGAPADCTWLAGTAALAGG